LRHKRQRSGQGHTAPSTKVAPSQAWLSDLARQLDAVIEEDPKRRSAGALVARALIREALKGDIRAIKECLRLADQAGAHASLAAAPPDATPRKKGRPRKSVDLDEIRELAREGLWNAAQIGRVLRVTKQTLLGPAHAGEVKDAIEDGKALWALDQLRRFNEMVRARRFDPAVLYATKQAPIGWSDRQTLVGSDGAPIPVEIVGATERLIEAVLKYQQKRLAEAPS
jgi:hypothetical protein